MICVQCILNLQNSACILVIPCGAEFRQTRSRISPKCVVHLVSALLALPPSRYANVVSIDSCPSGITCRNGSRSKSYWTKTRQGIKLVNALSEESVGQTNHGLEANPTTDSSLKPSRGECSPASRSPRDDFPDSCFSGLKRCLSRKDLSAQNVEASDGRRCYNSQPGEHRRSDFSPGDGAHGKEEVSEPPP